MIKRFIEKIKEKKYSMPAPLDDERDTDERRIAGEDTSEVATDFLINTGRTK